VKVATVEKVDKL